ncbi:MAG: hypothetical protein CGU28_13225 [Candidatus Dactylopiibacterium carminicum]|uniref:EI24 domain-containing protein n=1 Tax=Candidatus Dactylopiibacterium carminicum TaxID=857335 RepID=A0A272EPA0_9RHOO|nr:hypothetical protein BGI27_14110 [Candidatus Dactylopiibacterium carminicum]PAS91921.1 MAG: hypothetical protein CGU29_13915 [Candidatus Dactylopiibacterium carminicum]PAS94977.1 MAG: hypothetical protein CGU28_13225 [Candidatus Dactylopiibacterium carminicum]
MILWHMLWPTLLSVALWLTLLLSFGATLAGWLLHGLEAWPWLGRWILDAGADTRHMLLLAAQFVLWLMALPLIYVTAAFLVSAFAIGFMLEHVGGREYGELVRRQGGSMRGSVLNSMATLLLFLVLLAITLPLWFLPGLGILLSLLLVVWLNKRCYAYDALMLHADTVELLELPRRHRGSLWLLGLGCGVLGFVPILNLLVPALTGLAYVHYLLEALRIERRGG